MAARFTNKLLVLILLHWIGSEVVAQDPSFAVYMDNTAYTAVNQFEFDVMLKSMGNTSAFQLRTFQACIYVDAAWLGSGNLSVSNLIGSSALSAAGYNGTFNWNATDKVLNCSVNLDVRTSTSGCYSTVVGAAPLRIARLRLTNSFPFACASPNLKFNYVHITTPLRLRTSLSWRVSGCSVNYE